MLSCRTTLLALTILGSGAFLSAQAPTPKIADLEATVARNGMDVAALKDLGEHYFGRAVEGDKGAVERGWEIFLSLRQLEPTNAAYHGRLGSLYAMKGRDASLPMARMWFVQQGLESMGKAVALAPDDLGIRLTRANTCSALPAQFQQIETAIQDCQHVDRLMTRAPQHFQKGLVFQTRLLLASSLKKAGRDSEARPILEKLQTEAQGTPFAAQAKELLK